MKDDYEDTRALNELVEEVSKRKEEFTDTIEIVDNTNNNESSEEVYNNLVGTDEDTKVLDNIKDIINEDSNKDEEEKEEVKDTKKDKKKKKESLIDKFKKLSKKKKIIVISCFALGTNKEK